MWKTTASAVMHCNWFHSFFFRFVIGESPRVSPLEVATCLTVAVFGTTIRSKKNWSCSPCLIRFCTEAKKRSFDHETRNTFGSHRTVGSCLPPLLKIFQQLPRPFKLVWDPGIQRRILYWLLVWRELQPRCVVWRITFRRHSSVPISGLYAQICTCVHLQ